MYETQIFQREERVGTPAERPNRPRDGPDCTCLDPRLELPAVEHLLAVVGGHGAAARGGRVLGYLRHPSPSSGDLTSAAAVEHGFLPSQEERALPELEPGEQQSLSFGQREFPADASWA
jgi:hypothetical protein